MNTETNPSTARFRPGTTASPVARVPRFGTVGRPELVLAKAA
ncbi:MAG: hypothetical protein ACR2QE_16530 [Acidimicrobiales bacterium]